MALKIIVIIIVLLIILFNILAWVFMWQTFRPLKIDDNTAINHYDAYKDRYSRLNIQCMCQGNNLKGYLFKSGNKSASYSDYPVYSDIKEFLGDTVDCKGLILFIHGIWSGPDEYMQTLLPLVDRGYVVMAFNATSYNGSEGKWARGLATSMLNADAELTFIENHDEFKGMKVFLLGHSWGAYAVTSVLRFRHNVQAVVSLSGFNKPMDITRAVGKTAVGPLSGIICSFIGIYQKIFFGKYYNCSAVDGINQKVPIESEIENTGNTVSGGSENTSNNVSDVSENTFNGRYVPVLVVHGINDAFIKFDETSIYSKKNEIENPDVLYLKLEEKGRSEHNSYFNSKAGSEYNNKINEYFSELAKKYKGDELIREKKKYLVNVDRELANEPNEWLIEKIDDFFMLNQ